MYGLQSFTRSMICQVYSATFLVIVPLQYNGNTQAPCGTCKSSPTEKWFARMSEAVFGVKILFTYRCFGKMLRYIMNGVRCSSSFDIHLALTLCACTI